MAYRVRRPRKRPAALTGRHGGDPYGTATKTAKNRGRSFVYRATIRRATLRAAGKFDVVGLAETLEGQAKALRRTTPGKDFREGARLPLDLLDNVLGPKVNRQVQVAGAIIGDVFNNPVNIRAQQEAARLNKLNRESFARGEFGDTKPVTLTGVDVLKGNDLAAVVGSATDKLRDRFGELADKVLPNFGKRIESLTERLTKPEDKPFNDFQRDLLGINLLSNPLARIAGVGISNAEARRLRAEVGEELIERFRPAEVHPAPLVRAGSQEAEQAITRAVYESRNASLDPAEELAAALKAAKEAEDKNTDSMEKLAALDNTAGRNVFPAVGIGFGGK